MPPIPELAQRFRDFASVSTRTRAPLYSRLSTSVADDHDLLALLHHAPETQQLPVLLFAGVHHLLLDRRHHPLATHYPNLAAGRRAEGDALALFRSFALDHAHELTAVIATRNTQTNEVGRCSQFLPVLGLLEAEMGPLAHIDVGTSAGLNLLLPRFHYTFEPGGTVGDVSPVQLHCDARGEVPLPTAMPRIVRSVGLDMAPIDVLDDTEVRWLEACCWPDQADRFARLVAAIELARAHPPDVRRGDAVTGVSAIVDELTEDGHPVITNSWVLNYLPHEVRLAYVDELDRIGASRDLSWIIAEAPAQTPGLPVATTEPPEEITVISLVRWRSGRRTADRLATTHPHGYWINWSPTTGGASPQPS